MRANYFHERGALGPTDLCALLCPLPPPFSQYPAVPLEDDAFPEVALPPLSLASLSADIDAAAAQCRDLASISRRLQDRLTRVLTLPVAATAPPPGAGQAQGASGSADSEAAQVAALLGKHMTVLGAHTQRVMLLVLRLRAVLPSRYATAAPAPTPHVAAPTPVATTVGPAVASRAGVPAGAGSGDQQPPPPSSHGISTAAAPQRQPPVTVAGAAQVARLREAAEALAGRAEVLTDEVAALHQTARVLARTVGPLVARAVADAEASTSTAAARSRLILGVQPILACTSIFCARFRPCPGTRPHCSQHRPAATDSVRAPTSQPPVAGYPLGLAGLAGAVPAAAPGTRNAFPADDSARVASAAERRAEVARLEARLAALERAIASPPGAPTAGAAAGVLPPAGSVPPSSGTADNAVGGTAPVATESEANPPDVSGAPAPVVETPRSSVAAWAGDGNVVGSTETAAPDAGDGMATPPVPDSAAVTTTPGRRSPDVLGALRRALRLLSEVQPRYAALRTRARETQSALDAVRSELAAAQVGSGEWEGEGMWGQAGEGSQYGLWHCPFSSHPRRYPCCLHTLPFPSLPLHLYVLPAGASPRAAFATAGSARTVRGAHRRA